MSLCAYFILAYIANGFGLLSGIEALGEDILL